MTSERSRLGSSRTGMLSPPAGAGNSMDAHPCRTAYSKAGQDRAQPHPSLSRTTSPLCAGHLLVVPHTLLESSCNLKGGLSFSSFRIIGGSQRKAACLPEVFHGWQMAEPGFRLNCALIQMPPMLLEW